MDIPFPSQLQWVTPVVGSHWPAGSESAWWRTAGYLRAHAAELEAHTSDLQRVRSQTQAVLVGETAQVFKQQFAQLFSGDSAVDKKVQALRSLGDAAETLGTEIQYTKLSIYSMLVIAAASIMFAVANSEWTLGASLAQIPIIRWLTENAMARLVSMVLGRIEAELAARLGSMLVARLVVEGAVSAGIGAAQEAGIEAIQIAEGRRDGIDVGTVLHSALSIGAAGLAGGWAGHEVGGLLGTEGNTAMRAIKGAVTGLASAEAANLAGTLAGGGHVGADTFLGGAIGVVHGGLGGGVGEHGAPLQDPTDSAVPANAIDTHPTLRLEKQPDGTFAWPGETANGAEPQAHTASPTATTEPPVSAGELGAGAGSHALPGAADPGARAVEATTTPTAAADAGLLPATSVTAGLDVPPTVHASVGSHLAEGTLDRSIISPAAHTGPTTDTASPAVFPPPLESYAVSPATPTMPSAGGPPSPAPTVASPAPTSSPASPGSNAGLSSSAPDPHAGPAEISPAGKPSSEPAGALAAGRFDTTVTPDADTHHTAAEQAASTQAVRVDHAAPTGRSAVDAHLLGRSEGTRADSVHATDPLTTRRDPARPDSTRDDSNRPRGARPAKLPRRSSIARDIPEDLQPAGVTLAPEPPTAEGIGVIKARHGDTGPGPHQPESHKGGRDGNDGQTNTPDPSTAGGAGDSRGGNGGHRGGAGDGGARPGDGAQSDFDDEGNINAHELGETMQSYTPELERDDIQAQRQAATAAGSGETGGTDERRSERVYPFHQQQSPRELIPLDHEVISLVAQGLNNKQIADQLSVTENTVKNHLKYVLAKLDARDRAQLVAIAYRRGLLDPGDASEALRERLTDLTPRLREVFSLVAQGLNNKQIADQLGIAENTVNSYYVKYLQRTLHAHNRAHLIAIAYRLGLLDPGDASEALRERLTDLTPRLREVISLVAQGLNNKQIADQLSVTENTVKNHLKYVLAKLDARDRAQLVAIAYRLGLLDPGDASEALRERLTDLTPRLRDVFSLVAQGLNNKQIADQLGITENTVKNHLKYVLAKLDARDRAQLVAIAYRLGLLDPGDASEVDRLFE
jgi:DNA-binding NarL/FixJ family response regulator